VSPWHAARAAKPGCHDGLAVAQHDNGHGIHLWYIVAEEVGTNVAAGVLVSITKPRGDGSLEWGGRDTLAFPKSSTRLWLLGHIAGGRYGTL
jgi:hypothetical protein